MGLSGETIQTLVLLWVFTWLGMAIMGLRLLMRKVRGRTLNLSDKITIVCMLCLLARLAFIHIVLIWGTNKLSAQFRAGHTFSPGEIFRRETGSKLLLVSRIIYNTYLWLQKCVVMLLYQHILCGLHHTGVVMKAYWVIFAATYIVIQVVTFTDCQPIYLYWQVVPDPGKCSRAIGQLLILGGLNIFTDILLIILPMPTLLRIKKQTLGAKLRLLTLFSLGVFLVAITVIRLPFNLEDAGMQINRTIWASVESFTAAIVANVPTLYTLRKNLPDRSTTLEKLNGGMIKGWMEDGKRSPDGAASDIDSSQPIEDEKEDETINPRKHVLAKKSIEIQERRKAMFIPPIPGKEDEMSEGWDRRARIKGGKMVLMDDAEWEKERQKDRVSMDSFMIFGKKF